MWSVAYVLLFQMSRAAVMAVERERNCVVQAARAAEIARVEAEREKLQQSVGRRMEAMDRKEREAELRERKRVQTLESCAVALATEGRKRELWFRLRRGMQLMAQKRRMQARWFCVYCQSL